MKSYNGISVKEKSRRRTKNDMNRRRQDVCHLVKQIFDDLSQSIAKNRFFNSTLRRFSKR